MTVPLFTSAVFLNAALMFIIQPMVGKVLLPSFGGAPQVWAACLVFFQLLLLGGYCLTHLGLPRLGPARMGLLQVLILIIACVIGITEPVRPSHEVLSLSPVTWSLRLAWRMCGLPFLMLAAGSPLLQYCFVLVTGRRDTPYWLFAAGNIGSLGGLLAFPLLIEPTLPLSRQMQYWNGLFVMLTVLYALLVWKILSGCREGIADTAASPAGPNVRAANFENTESEGQTVSTVRNAVAPDNPKDSSRDSVVEAARSDALPDLPPVAAWKWFVLAAVPSALLTAMTVHITTDLAPIPLLWVIPLALYLISFSIVFSSVPVRWSQTTVSIGMFAFVFAQRGYFSHGLTHAWGVVLITLFLGFFLFIFLHGELARRAPGPEHMTRFLLTMAAGGATGSIVSGFGPPLLFSGLWEYPMLMAFAAVLFARLLPAEQEKVTWQRFLSVLGIGLPIGVLLIKSTLLGLSTDWNGSMGAIAEMLVLILVGVFRPRRFGLIFAAFVMIVVLSQDDGDRVLARARSFFGCYEVVASEQRTLRYLNHGNIVHGGQCVSSILRDVPILYYHPSGPTGQVLGQYNKQRNVRVGIVGMGAGMVAAYSRFSHEYVFFEIDPEVIRIARDPHLFTYLADARGKMRVVCGDGRLGLAAEPEQSFDVIMFDAYSSDAIPVHLLTREAMQLFLSRLKPGGIMLFHLSNRYLRLEPVLGNLCQDLDLTALIQDHEPDEKALPPSEVGLVSPSRWALVASESAYLTRWLPDPRWKLLKSDPRVGVWTDQFSSLLSIFKK